LDMKTHAASILVSIATILGLASPFNAMAQPRDRDIHAGGEGVFLSPGDGIVWTQTGLRSVSVYSLATRPNGQLFASAYPGGVFRSTDHGNTWTDSVFGNELFSAFAFGDSGIIFGASYGGLIFQSTDGGETWDVRDKTLVYWSTRYNSLVSTDNGYLFAGAERGLSPCPCGHGVYRSTNNGFQWLPTSLTLGIGPMTTDLKGNVYAASDTLYRSTDYGETWTQVSSGLTVPLVKSLAHSGDGALFAGTSAGLFRSTDNGDHWTISGLTGILVKTMAIHPLGTVIAGTDSGIFVSTNDGDSWSQADSGLTRRGILSLTVDSSGYVYAGTSDSGVFRSVQPVSAVHEVSGLPPKSYLLSQNYPNPFNPVTTIDFSVPRAGPVLLRVFNVLGEEVATLVSDDLPPGSYRTRWNAAGIGSGVYFYRLQAGSFLDTKKLILLQ
jgi:photosystem II stability/assembly factor-like uncharacterized protein